MSQNLRILSFDVGEVTLTYCLILGNKESYNIIDWKLTSIRTDENLKKAKNSTQKIDNLISFLQKTFPSDFLLDYVLIEDQGSFRPFMKSIQNVIYTYFKLQNIDVRLRHAINKFKLDMIPDEMKISVDVNKTYTYARNKKLSKLYVSSIIPKEILNKYVKDKSCLDDYSDALLQAIFFIK